MAAFFLLLVDSILLFVPVCAEVLVDGEARFVSCNRLDGEGSMIIGMLEITTDLQNYDDEMGNENEWTTWFMMK